MKERFLKHAEQPDMELRQMLWLSRFYTIKAIIKAAPLTCVFIAV